MVTRLSGSDQQTLSGAPADVRVALGSYHVELPQALLDADEQVLDWVIAFAFDTLDARHLDMRITTAGGA